jgi:DNA polymerase I-like protein with 3'-5' exonuclease and polymerase domains
MGPIVFSNSVNCFPNGSPITEKMVEACRPYVAGTIAEAKPERILALGPEAAESLTGRRVPIGSVQGGYQFLFPGSLVDRHIPIFFLPHPSSIRGNHLRKRDFEQQLDHALMRPHPKLPPIRGKAHVVRSEADALAVEAEITAIGEFADLSIDIETFGVPFDDIEIICAGLALAGRDDAWVWPDSACQDPKVRAPLVRIIQNPDIRKVLQNGKSDAGVLLFCWQCEIGNFGFDTRIGRRLHTADATAKLAVLSELVGMGGYKQAFESMLDAAVKQLQKETKYIRQTKLLLDRDAARLERAARRIAGGENPKRYAYGLVPEDKLSVYNGLDCVTTARVGVRIEADLDSVVLEHAGKKIRPLRGVMTRGAMPANRALIWMEQWGVPVSRRGLQELSAHLSRKLVDLQAEFDRYNCNPDSTPQLVDLLYRKLRLPVLEHTEKGQPSTDAEVLEKLKGKHPIVETLLAYRSYERMRGTYVDGMLPHIRPDGRIHPNIMADGTRTGRVSVSDPNMNNWVRPEEDGPPEPQMLRDCVVAPPGWLVVEADEDQCELRVAAAESGDPVMIGFYQKPGADFHLETARRLGQLMFGMDPATITKKTMDPKGRWGLRQGAKQTNFLSIYGGGAGRLAAQMGCSYEDATTIVGGVQQTFQAYFRWSAAQIALVRREGYVWTRWDGQPWRRRPLFDVANPKRGDDREDARRITAEHGAGGNTRIQSTASEIVVSSLYDLVDWVQRSHVRAQVCLTIYDSIVSIVHEDDLNRYIDFVVPLMTRYQLPGNVPLIADVKIGKSWGSLKSYTRKAA